VNAVKKYFRPVAYSIIVLLVALAMFAKNPPEAGQVEHSPGTVGSPRALAADAHSPFLVQRSDQDPAPALFSVAKKAPPSVPVAAPVATEAPPPDIKILGWMMSESVPHVFVDWKNESYTLTPGESLDGIFRFEKIGAGFADFIYLPTGETRRYTVSDPALIE